MADVRVNGKRITPLQSVDNLALLIKKLEALGHKTNSSLTALSVNQSFVDLENKEILKLKLKTQDTIEARLDTPEQLSYESLQVSLEMANLLVFDLKIVTLKLWDSTQEYAKSLENLLNDCHLFLSLAARPLCLLQKKPEELEHDAQIFLKQLDLIAQYLEDTTLLAVHGHKKEACYMLVGKVKPAIEQWIGLSGRFAQILDINSLNNKNSVT
jgi:hypothetical protein